MPTPDEMRDKLWSVIKSDRTVMLGLTGVDNAHTRPMTGFLEEDAGPIWFFGSNESHLVRNVTPGCSATGVVVDKGHNLFASVRGRLTVDNDAAMIDKLWNPYVAAWYEGGKTDPKLALLRFDAEAAEIWYDASSLVAAIKVMFGADPKASYKDHVATVKL